MSSIWGSVPLRTGGVCVMFTRRGTISGQDERVSLQGLCSLIEKLNSMYRTLKFSIYSIINAAWRRCHQYPNVMQGTDFEPRLKHISCSPDFLRDWRFSLVTTVTGFTYKRHITISDQRHCSSAKLLNNFFIPCWYLPLKTKP